MTPDPQLLTKQIVLSALDITGKTESVRFNLQRGKIARIWGFVWILSTFGPGSREYSVFVRKTPNAERAQIPSDNLWASIIESVVNGINWGFLNSERSIMFPKPHRTSGITVQMHAGQTTTTTGELIIYYDIDDVAKGELANRWEKSRGKKYDRRMLAP